ncbi:MAG: OmpA family protein [Candidatus Acidiferrales bacterium]|jgi:outer membrane protein OmpA-like peptidoglycan-associated protein
MRSAARFIATMAVAFVMAPALCADDGANPKTTAKNDDSASIIAPAAPAKAQPATAEPLPVRSSSTSSQSQSGAFAEPVAATQRWDDSEEYTPKVEWFLGYSFWRAMPTTFSNRMGYLHGGSTSVAYNFNRYVGLVADFGGYDNSRVTLFTPTASHTFDSNGSAYTYVFGPRFSYRYERFTPFAQALFGGTHASSVTISGCTGTPICTPLGSDNAFATMIGAGFDIKISRHVALRPFEGDFLLTHFRNPLSTGGTERGWQKNARFSTGIVFRFGGSPAPPPPAPLAATCSADKEMVYAGSGDLVVVNAQASNPGQNPLNYSWSASEGAVDGTGPEVRWNSSGRPPGTYTIKVRVDDGRNGAAACSVNVRVELRPNRPPTMSCSADRRAVTVGETVEITAIASDPDNDPLSFSWTASGGTIEGSGSSVRFHTADLPPGSYTITGHVDDGRGGTADCAVDADVQAAQPPAEVKELETRLALHSIYFATARPTVANPTGGLVESQQNVLLALANDFSRYLTYKPQAHLILEGHADRRGSIEYNQDLTERRVERAKSFLVEHGVPAANIETRALGKQENLDAEQVKQLVEQNPDLSDEERQRIESNLEVIVLANNRRVDVSLNTTGQQSVRQYPFNAKDSLTLLSTKGGQSEKRTRPPAGKKTAKP